MHPRLALMTLALLALPAAFAQETGWRRPPEAVARLALAPLPSQASLDPRGEVLLVLEREALPPLADLARPMLRLAGLRIDAARSAPHGPRRWRGLSFVRLADKRALAVALPEGAAPDRFSWSADGARVAFTCTREAGVELWVAEAATGEARALTGPTLMAAGGSAFGWLPDGRLLARFVPAGRGAAPERPPVPAGPVTSETQGRATPVRTLQDLLQDEHDMRLFDHHLTSQLAIVDLTGERTDVGAPAVWTSVAPSPDGKWLLTGRTERPYSTLVGWDAFPERLEVRALDGSLVREVAKLPLRDDVPIQGVARGPRDVEWQASARPGEPALLAWAEAQDDGDPKKKVPHRDRLFVWSAPFEVEGPGAPRALLEVEHRFTGLRWLERPGGETATRALVSEYDRDRRWARTWLVTLAGTALAGEPRKVWDRSVKDVYAHPGNPLDTKTAANQTVLRVRGGALLLAGRGATPAGDLPFLDRLDLASLETTRLWRCEPGSYEDVQDVLDDAGTRVLTRHETPDTPPNYWVRTLGAEPAREAVTSLPDPQPELRGIKKQLLSYARDDGVPLSGTLYTPAGWTPEQGRLPLLIWAYPQEFNDAATAGQVSGSPSRFTQFVGPSHLLLVTQGWAILDSATMPVIGDPETANDTFVKQIVASAKAAIDHVAGLAVADPSRVAVAGHSYGAFMTANLLAHCDLFRAGVARSGAYNRTLTPFGFQGERRTLWEARDTYAQLSPFTWADKIKTPLLMIHGQLDPNPGTFPLQSERLFHAIQGNGGTARLVELPYEGHGYVARESVLHVLAETIDWLNKHVRQAPVRRGDGVSERE